MTKIRGTRALGWTSRYGEDIVEAERCPGNRADLRGGGPVGLKWHLVVSAELWSYQVGPDKIEVGCPDLSGAFGDWLGCRCST
ncbi:hypothetical protein [Micromonospora ureilytica]|uniref:hypothetical protein n=1 Tax=Micromonospora ureilytica TaxID=709868 RepID=UPI004039F631